MLHSGVKSTWLMGAPGRGVLCLLPRVCMAASGDVDEAAERQDSIEHSVTRVCEGMRCKHHKSAHSVTSRISAMMSQY